MSQPLPLKSLRNIEPGKIWVQESRFRFLGVEIGGRMTVIRLSDGSLLLHVPVDLKEDMVRDLSRLGEVKYLVAPNDMHHLFLHEYAAVRYPEARLYAGPGLMEKRKDLNYYASLKDHSEEEWAMDLDQCIFHGHQSHREVVFYHRESKTLLLTDLLVHFCEESPPLTQFLTKMFGFYGKPVPPLDFKPETADMELTRQSVERILKWDFQRIILAHGRIIERDAQEVFRTAFGWVWKQKKES